MKDFSVHFDDRRFDEKMSYKNFENEDQNRPKEKFIFQRWLYGLFGCLTMAPIVTLTLAQLNNLPRENNQFGVYFLLFFVSSRKKSIPKHFHVCFSFFPTNSFGFDVDFLHGYNWTLVFRSTKSFR